MNIEKNQTNDYQVEFIIRPNKTEVSTYLAQAAARLSQHRPIKGYRPGKASLDAAKREFGEAAILSEALEDIINGTFNDLLQTEKITTYGKINFDLLPAEANEAVAYKATATLMPSVTLGNWHDKKIARQEVNVTPQELNKALDELATMATTEEITDRPSANGDKVIIDFEVFVDGKLIDGGKASDFNLIIGEGRMIPGFEEKLIDHKTSDKIEFSLNFPEDYQAGHLSGKSAEFKITIKQVLARSKAVINDEFAKQVGVADVNALKERISENLLKEKQDKEEERFEISAIKQVVDSSQFGTIPPIMVSDAVADLVQDLEHNLAHQQIKLEQYLHSIGKTLEQIKKDYESKALDRIKSSLALSKLAEDEKLMITKEEIDDELEAHMKEHNHSRDEISKPEFRRHVASSLINRKIINFIIQKISS